VERLEGTHLGHGSLAKHAGVTIDASPTCSRPLPHHMSGLGSASSSRGTVLMRPLPDGRISPLLVGPVPTVTVSRRRPLGVYCATSTNERTGPAVLARWAKELAAATTEARNGQR
jgi:hypothetical protein